MKSSVIGISIALIIFTMIGIIFDIGYGGTFLMKGYSFTKMAIGSILVGIGFVVGWIPSSLGIGGVIGYIAADAGLVMLIWFFFYRHYQKEATEMNKKIAEKQV